MACNWYLKSVGASAIRCELSPEQHEPDELGYVWHEYNDTVGMVVRWISGHYNALEWAPDLDKQAKEK
jgi:hypothetical protein